MKPLFIQHIENRLSEGLPGRAHQLKMANFARMQNIEAPPTARQAAVMQLLFEKNGEWHILLTERVGNPNDPHSKQISFPGGSLEANDPSLEHCALRETHEEVGIAPHTLKVIAQMTGLYIPVSNFQVTPFLAYSDTPPQYQRQETEVHQILEAPIRLLQSPDALRITDLELSPSRSLKDVPYFDVYGKIVWGATAMMLAELLEILPVDKSI